MSDPNTRSAEGEPWWPEFVNEFGKTPLRELARRYNTNPRRLRRAAQRSGLTDEPENLQAAIDRLGTCADITLAEELGVTVEMIAGARRRRRIAAFDPTKAPPKPPKPEPEPAPQQTEPRSRDTRERPPRERQERARAERKARYRPDPDAVVVVRRRPTPDIAPSAPPPGALDNLTRALKAHPPSPTNSALPSPPSREEKTRPRRRRIITKTTDRDDSSEPEPGAAEPATPKRRAYRRKPTSAASEVRIVDTAAAPALMDELVEEMKVELEVAAERKRPVIAPTTPRIDTSTPRIAPAPVAVPPAPTLLEELQSDLYVNLDADALMWVATIQHDDGDRDIVICADTIVEAARIASTHGTIARLDRAPML